mgnify:FL=1
MNTAARLSPDPLVVLAASLDLQVKDGVVPDWIQLTPAVQGEIATYDGRGPYRIADATAVVAATMADGRGIPIDENHATDLAAPQGREAPARGWVREMQVRDNGIWGRVEWNAAGRALVADKAYRGISPVLMLDPADKKTVRSIPRASLVNVPNLRGLAALNQENSMASMAKMAAKLGLAEDASEDDILAAIGKLQDKKSDGDKGDMPAMQSALADIGVAFGLAADAKPEAIAAAAKLAKSGTADIVALQSELTSVKAELTTLKTAGSRAASEAFIDKAIADRRAGVNAQNREELIALHMSQKDVAESLVNGMPMLTTTGTVETPRTDKDGKISLNAAQKEACAALGLSEELYLKTLAEEAR